VKRHAIDLVVLIDDGTDSVIFGDEPGLGTVAEDAVSVLAAWQAAGDRTLLVAIGFGIDHFHGVSHHSFLKNVARLSREGGFLGGFPLMRGTREAEAFLDLVDYAIGVSRGIGASSAIRSRAPFAASSATIKPPIARAAASSSSIRS